jgi:hypothetical protein
MALLLVRVLERLAGKVGEGHRPPALADLRGQARQFADAEEHLARIGDPTANSECLAVRTVTDPF